MFKSPPSKWATRLFFLWLLSSISFIARADFVVSDIRVEGAQNIEVGTIFNYLPIKVGDVADDALVNDAIKTLFATGNYASSPRPISFPTLIPYQRKSHFQ